MLYLVLENFAPERVAELQRGADGEVFVLTEANAAEALQKIFAAESVSVWTELTPGRK